jgi:5-methyltetrahydrofolate--homocysteine methyltransferase
MTINDKTVIGKIRDSIIEFDIDNIAKLCEDAMAVGITAYEVVMSGMAKGMEIVGKKYEVGEYFLAELIMAGETMKEGMNVLEPHLSTGDHESAGKCIIGTVKGDLHDIGKNVFVSLLRAENYKVIDLGVDVTPKQYLEAVIEHNPTVVGMSALLTTTMGEMMNVISMLEREGVRKNVKVIIGGAPVTQEFALKIGADAAAKDAFDGVRICRDWSNES